MVIGVFLDMLLNVEGYLKIGNIYLCLIWFDKNWFDVIECLELNFLDVGKIGKLIIVYFI